MADTKKCEATDCEKDARCAIRTARPTRANLYSTVWYDDRSAPKTAVRYCHGHGVETMTQLAQALIDQDDEEETDGTQAD